MHIYLARSIRGDQPTDGRLTNALRILVRKLGHATQFDIDHELSRCGVTNEQYVYARDIFWIDHCHAMIAEVTYASHGVGYEIAYAHHVRHMPIMLVAQKDTTVSAMLAGRWPIQQYRDTAHLFTFVQQFLEEQHA